MTEAQAELITVHHANCSSPTVAPPAPTVDTTGTEATPGDLVHYCKIHYIYNEEIDVVASMKQELCKAGVWCKSFCGLDLSMHTYIGDIDTGGQDCVVCLDLLP